MPAGFYFWRGGLNKQNMDSNSLSGNVWRIKTWHGVSKGQKRD